MYLAIAWGQAGGDLADPGQLPQHREQTYLITDMPEGYTEGCVALPDAELDVLLGWLNPADRPHILITIG